MSPLIPPSEMLILHNQEQTNRWVFLPEREEEDKLVIHIIDSFLPPIFEKKIKQCTNLCILRFFSCQIRVVTIEDLQKLTILEFHDTDIYQLIVKNCISLKRLIWWSTTRRVQRFLMLFTLPSLTHLHLGWDLVSKIHFAEFREETLLSLGYGTFVMYLFHLPPLLQNIILVAGNYNATSKSFREEIIYGKEETIMNYPDSDDYYCCYQGVANTLSVMSNELPLFQETESWSFISSTYTKTFFKL